MELPSEDASDLLKYPLPPPNPPFTPPPVPDVPGVPALPPLKLSEFPPDIPPTNEPSAVPPPDPRNDEPPPYAAPLENPDVLSSEVFELLADVVDVDREDLLVSADFATTGVDSGNTGSPH